MLLISILAGLLSWIFPHPWKDAEDAHCLSALSQVTVSALQAHKVPLKLSFSSMGASKAWEL